MKTPYADYAKHAMRIYLRKEPGGARLTSADLKNKLAINSALASMMPQDKELLIRIYNTWDIEHPFKDVIAELATERQIPIKDLWAMCNAFEYRFARIRGLW